MESQAPDVPERRRGAHRLPVLAGGPSDTLTGPSVSLTATAADDRDVAGVRFRLDGQDLGPEVTAESRPTRFILKWDSRSVPSGTHTLTATARDAAGNTTTSEAITVTVRN